MTENGNIQQNGHSEVGSFKVKDDLAQILKDGVIMDGRRRHLAVSP